MGVRSFLIHTVVICAVFSAMAAAQTATGKVGVKATVSGAERTGTVFLYDYESTAYLSLQELVQVLGGGITVYTDRVKADLAGGTAWLNAGGVEVDASGGAFNLKRPLHVSGRHAYLAMSDVAAFLQSAFGIPASIDLDVDAGTQAVDESIMEESVTAPDQGLTLTNQSGAEAAWAPLRTVMIDPGHGGLDAGVQGKSTGVIEKDLTLALAQQLQKTLETALGSTVLLTRDGDTGLTAEERTSMANTRDADLFISLHGGASPAPNATGFIIFTPDEDGRDSMKSAELAQRVGEKLAAATAAPNLGQRRMPCRLFRNLQMPGLLIEVGMISNAEEEARLADATYQAKLVDAITTAVVEFTGGAPAPEPVESSQ